MLAVALAAIAIALAILLYVSTGLADASARDSDARYAQVAVLYDKASSDLTATRVELTAATRDRDAAITKRDALAVQLAAPTIVWNSCSGPCTMTAGKWREGTVPDTFAEIMQFDADVPVTVYWLALEQYAQWLRCGGIACVTGKFQSAGPAKSLSVTFTLAEGCASYVHVLQSASTGTLRPRVAIKSNPASAPTGVCATGP